MNGEKLENCSKRKDENGRLEREEREEREEDEVRRTLKGYFEDLYNIDIQEQAAVPRCSYEGV